MRLTSLKNGDFCLEPDRLEHIRDVGEMSFIYFSPAEIAELWKKLTGHMLDHAWIKSEEKNES